MSNSHHVTLHTFTDSQLPRPTSDQLERQQQIAKSICHPTCKPYKTHTVATWTKQDPINQIRKLTLSHFEMSTSILTSLSHSSQYSFLLDKSATSSLPFKTTSIKIPFSLNRRLAIPLLLQTLESFSFSSSSATHCTSRDTQETYNRR